MKKDNNEPTKPKSKNTNIIISIIILFIMILLRLNYFLENNLDTEILFKDPDTCYHARRIIYIATNNMNFPFYDPLIAHPIGAIPRWPPLYDWLGALPSFLLSFIKPSSNFIILTAAIINVFYGLIALILFALLIYKLTNNFYTSILTILFIGTTYPQIKYTSINNLDHNSLLLLLLAGILYSTYKIIAKSEIKYFSALQISLSILLAALFWTWAGSYIYVIPIALIHFIFSFLNKKYKLLLIFASNYLIAGLLILPLALIHYKLNLPPFKLGYVSFFTVLFMLSMSIFLVFTNKLISLLSYSIKKLFILTLIPTIVIISAIIFIALPNLLIGFKVATASNVWLASIAESQPLFYTKNEIMKIFTLDKIISFFGYPIFLYPIALLLILSNKIKVNNFTHLIITINTFFFAFLSFNQQKYTFELAIPYGFNYAIFLVWLYEKFLKKGIIFLIITFALLIIGFKPIIDNFSEGSSDYLSYINSFKWLSKQINIKNSEINTGSTQNIGLMAPWDLGHHIKLYANMPTVADNFGMSILPFTNFYDMANFFLSEDEKEAIRILNKYKCQYIIVPSFVLFEHYPAILNREPTLYFNFKSSVVNGKKRIVVEPTSIFFNTIAFRLSYMYGSANPFTQKNIAGLTALKHFRLIYESPAITNLKKSIPAGITKIYKYVNGYELILNEPKNLNYKLEAPILTNNNRIFLYRQDGNVADKIIVPYPTYQSSNYPYALYYKIMINDKIYEFKNINEKDIE